MLKSISASLGEVALAIAKSATRSIFNDLLAHRFFMKRRRAIQGDWSGFVDQADTLNQPFRFAVHTKFQAKLLSLGGTLTYDDPCNRFELALEGRFAHQDILEFRYENVRQGTKQFGYCFLYLSPDGKSMRGKFIGHGIVQYRIVSGDLVLGRRP